ncbi:MAG: histidine kinase, partial [Bacteroidetes bacterium]|nr:histidine kinase [Bacteroidota bacterium]
MPLVQSFSINLFVIILTEIAILRDRKQKIETENTILRLANLEARHSQLKQQLHPHFLFNSLNILNSLIRKNPAQAEEYLVKLSELLRFTIYSNKQATVSLARELELSINYLNMQKVRFNEALDVSIDVDPVMQQDGYVPVYSIQLLIENAIKHNILTAQKPLHISITGDIKMNSVTVANNIQSKLTVEDESGVGLSNLAERYRLLGNKPINIVKDAKKFSVIINVLENENSNN